jgi:hypothetical protein
LSFEAHPLGIPAVVILLARIIAIFRKNRIHRQYLYIKTIHHG